MGWMILIGYNLIAGLTAGIIYRRLHADPLFLAFRSWHQKGAALAIVGFCWPAIWRNVLFSKIAIKRKR